MQRRTRLRRFSARDVRGRWRLLTSSTFLAWTLCCPAFAQDLDLDDDAAPPADAGDDSDDPGEGDPGEGDPEATGEETSTGSAEGETNDGDGASPTEDAPPAPDQGDADGPLDPRFSERAMPRGRAVDSAGNPLLAAHFDSPDESLRIFLGPARPQRDPYGVGMGRPRLDTGELQELCAAPCARWIYPGEYTFGAALPTEPGERERQPLRARQALLVNSPVLITTNYQSYGWLRAVGWATMGAGLIGGSALVLVAYNRCAGDGLCLQDSPYAWLGAGSFFLGVTGGLLLTLKGDEVSFSVTPDPRLPEPH